MINILGWVIILAYLAISLKSTIENVGAWRQGRKFRRYIDAMDEDIERHWRE